MTSEKRQHVDSFGRPTFEPSTEVGIRSDLREDLYIVYAGSVDGTEEAVYRFTINPLVWWVWFGGIVLAVGGIVTMWPGGGPTIAPAARSAGPGGLRGETDRDGERSDAGRRGFPSFDWQRPSSCRASGGVAVSPRTHWQAAAPRHAARSVRGGPPA